MASKTYTTSEINDIYNARKVLINILERRGFDTTGYNNFNVNEIQSMAENDQLDMLLNSKEEDGGEPIKKMFVKYHLTKLSNPAVYDIIDDLFSVDDILSKKDELIIIVKDKPNVKIQQLVELIYKTDSIYFNISSVKEYMFNILDHNMVPQHRVMTNAEKENVKNKYNVVKDKEFPEISRFDPVAKVIGLRPGQLCEIIRPSPTSIKSIYYRLCI